MCLNSSRNLPALQADADDGHGGIAAGKDLHPAGAAENGERDPGGIGERDVAAATDALIAAIAQHRVPARETDPPIV